MEKFEFEFVYEHRDALVKHGLSQGLINESMKVSMYRSINAKSKALTFVGQEVTKVYPILRRDIKDKKVFQARSGVVGDQPVGVMLWRGRRLNARRFKAKVWKAAYDRGFEPKTRMYWRKNPKNPGYHKVHVTKRTLDKWYVTAKLRKDRGVKILPGAFLMMANVGKTRGVNPLIMKRDETRPGKLVSFSAPSIPAMIANAQVGMSILSKAADIALSNIPKEFDKVLKQKLKLIVPKKKVIKSK